VVNPKMLPEVHPLRRLPGVGCAYKLVEALYDRAAWSGGGSAEFADAAARHLDLVALGIVADVAVQTGDTRYLLQRGLDALRHTERVGLQVMIEVAELNPAWLTEEHIGFVLGPRLNALGRLADANVAVEFLTTDDLARARILATELEGLNGRRKLLCDQVARAAESQIERDPSLLEHGALVLNHPSWPPGVIGIVAGRLAERYRRPTVLISTPPGELGRGSARSVSGCNISAAIAAHGEMLESFGGHPMAAGLAIDPERIPEFRRALLRTVLEMCGEAMGKATLQIDDYVPLSDLSLDLVGELERLAPFGAGNPPLTLASRRLVLKSHSPIGRSSEHLQLVVEDEEAVAQKVLWWQGAGLPLPQGCFDLAYAVRASDYQGQRDVQVEWVDARPIEAPVVPLHLEPPAVRIIDCRRKPNLCELLAELRMQEDVQVWGEAGAREEVAGQDRYGLSPSRALVIWTTPPGPGELRAVLKRVSPEVIYLFGIDPGLDRLEEFVKRLAGLTKHALSANQGSAQIATLAAATAHRETTVQAGLAWLAARGYLMVLDEDSDEIQLVAGGQVNSADLPRITGQLEALLEETAAYRAHFARAEKDTLMPWPSQSR
jgi:single-stranded-DNA-specific exonuclease